MDTIYAPITWIQKTGDADQYREVFGIVSDDSLDSDKQRADLKWLAEALPSWFNQWGNIREMHKPSAVGKGVELTDLGGQWQLRARIIDKAAIEKIDNGIYQGFSIGVIWPKVVRDPSAPGGRIVGGDIVEVSVVDRPSNTNSKFVIAKAAGTAAGCDCCADCTGTEEQPCCEKCAVAAKAAIPHKDGQPQSPPAGKPEDKSQYADPENYGYQLNDKKHIQLAVAYYNAEKGKDKYTAEEWHTVGARIVAAANKELGEGYSLGDDGKIDTPSQKKFAAVGDVLLAALGKGEPNAAQGDVFEALKLSELDDSQLFLFLANLTRYAMIRRLHEPAEPDESLSDFMGQLGQIFDYFMQCSANEYSEAWSYLSGQIVQQLLTSHTLGQSIADAAGALEQMSGPTANTNGEALGKVGKTISQKTMGALRDSHDSITKLVGGQLCNDYVSANQGGGPDGTGGGPNADQETEMTAKEIEAMVTKAAEEAAAKAAEAVLAKQAEAQHAPVEPGQIAAQEIPDFSELLKQAIAPVLEQNAELVKRVASIEERASDEGPLVTAMQKQLTKTANAARLEQVDRLIADYEDRVKNHPAPQMRAAAAAELSKLYDERKLLTL